MNTLTVPYMTSDEFVISRSAYHPIGHEPWQIKQQPVSAGFKIAHCEDLLFLKFRVVEPFLKAKRRNINGLVNKDNCVEFFFAFGNDPGYYNFEFNCLGSVKAAYGSDRKQRKFLPSLLLKTIQDDITLSINNQAEGKSICWELGLTLNITSFYFHAYHSFSGLTINANFTKCGDELPEPHYLTWMDMKSPMPDFHQPKSFGRVFFGPKLAKDEAKH